MYPAQCNEGSISLTLTVSEHVCKYQHHSILYWITVQPVRVLHYPLACVQFFFFFLNKKIKTKQKHPRGFLGHELADPWKFRTPVSEALAEVTDRAGAEPEQLGFIASIRLSVCLLEPCRPRLDEVQADG